MKKKTYIVVKEYYTTTGRSMNVGEKVLGDEFCNGLLKHGYIEREGRSKERIDTYNGIYLRMDEPYVEELIGLNYISFDRIRSITFDGDILKINGHAATERYRRPTDLEKGTHY